MAVAETVEYRSFLGMLDPADRAALLRLGGSKRFRAGARIIVQGDHSDTVFLVLSGLVKVALDTADGREIVLSVLGPGDLRGEFEVLEGVRRVPPEMSPCCPSTAASSPETSSWPISRRTRARRW